MDATTPLKLAIAMGLVLDFSGALHVYGMHDARGEHREFILAAMLGLAAILWLIPRPAAEHEFQRGRPVWFAALAPAAVLLSFSDILTFIAPGWSITRAMVFCGGSLLLMVLGWRRASPWAIAGIALLIGIGIRRIHIRYVPIEPTNGDMLPLVRGALTNLFEGRSPYTTYSMPWELPLTYLPMTWLAYAPAFLTGLDFRWVNVVAELAVLGAAIFVARRRESLGGGRAVEAPLLLWAWLFLTPTVVHWDSSTTAPVGWAAIAWTLALVAARVERWAPVALGLAAATTPLITVVGPLIALCWLRNDGGRAALRKLAIAAAVAGVLLAPWIVWAPGAFTEGIVNWFNDLDRFPREKWETERTWAAITGFSGLFWVRGLEEWLKPIQAALMLLVAGLYLGRGAPRSQLFHHAVAAFLLFVLFNPVLWPYLYNPALVAALLAVAGIGSQTAPRPSKTVTTQRRRPLQMVSSVNDV